MTVAGAEDVAELVVGREDRVVGAVVDVLVADELVGVKSVPTAAVPPVLLLQLTTTAKPIAVAAAMIARRSCWFDMSASFLGQPPLTSAPVP